MRKLTCTLIVAAIFMGIGTGISESLAAELDTSALEEAYPILTMFKDIQLHGLIDTGFNYNFNQPNSRNNSTLRVFDRRTDSFTLNMIELSLEKGLKEDEHVGFRLDLDFGKDANITAPADTNSTDEFDIQEGYVMLRAPLGNGFDFKVGKFVTLLGAEVIEAPLNYNYSRSFLFGLAIPFTHTGLLGSYTFNDLLSFQAGIVNGWDVIEDNNDAKTFLGNISISPVEYFSIGVNGVYGAEQDNNDSSKRGVVDVVATLTPMDKLTLMLNYDYGEEEDAVTQGKTATWTGVAGYIHYDFLDWFGLTLRGEYFDDDDGARTGTGQELWETTATAEFKVYKDALLRLEYRHDESNEKPFTDENGNATGDQDTVAFEVAYIF